MSANLLVTKLHMPPGRPEHVLRQRLVDRLNQGLTRKLSLLAAPAGFGKTTLLSSWLRELDRPFAWLTLDKQDNDPARFFAYLIAALQQIDGRIGQPICGVLESPQVVSVESVITAILNDISGLASGFVLAIDDYHLLDATPCRRAVELLLRHAPPQMHLVIATREEPQLPLARLRVEGQLVEIRAKDLRFNSGEAAQFLQTVSEIPLSEGSLAVLQARTEGWIAGLQLAAISLRRQEAAAVDDFISTFGGSHQHVIDYLSDEVLTHQPTALREFMYQTAILDRLSGPLCDALTGRNDGSAVLKQLEQENLFLVPMDAQRTWYRYHQLFASYLRSELDERQRQAAHLRAAHWFEANGTVGETVHHLLASGNTDEAVAVIERAGYLEIQRGGLVTLSGWLDQLPEKVILTSIPLLAYRAMTSFLLTQSTDAEQYVDIMEKRMPPDAPPAVWGRLAGMRAWVASRKADFDNAVSFGEQALDLLGDEDPFAKSFVLVVLGQAREAYGDVGAAAADYRQAWTLAQQAGAPFAALLALINLALSLDSLGRRHEGLALCQQTLGLFGDQSQQVSPIAQVMYLPLGVLQYQAHDLANAVLSLRKGLEACTRYGLGSSVLVGRYYLGRALLADGKSEAALAVVEEGSSQAIILAKDRYHHGLYGSLRALISLQQGNLAAAERWVSSLDLADSTAAPYWYDQALITFIRVLQAQGRLEEARSALVDLDHRLGNARRWGALIPVCLQRATVEHALGNGEVSVVALDRSIRLAAAEGYVQPFVDQGPSVRKLLPAVRHIAPSFVDEVLRAIRIVTGEQPRPSLSLLDPLTPRELEVLGLIAQDLTNQEIADRLVVTLSTVKKHINRIFSKLDARDRTQAVLRAREQELL